MLERTYCVYKHTNRANGKVYIGVTSQLPRDRWDSGWGYQKNKHFWDAIQKYGWSGFDHEILASGLPPEEAFAKEQELILEYGSMDYRKGYNMTPGGETGPCLSGVSHPMYGKHHTPEARAKMSATRLGIPWSGERREACMSSYTAEQRREVALRTIAGYNEGRAFTDEHRRKIAESNRGLKRSSETRKRVSEAHMKPVLQLTKAGVFLREWPCAKVAAEALSIQAGHISKVCKNQRKTAGGFVWQYK